MPQAGAAPTPAADAAGASAVAPLLLAAQSGSTKLVRLLLQKGASAACASEAGVTPLMLLAMSGNLPAVKLLLEAVANGPPELMAAVVDATTENGTAAPHTAARHFCCAYRTASFFFT